MRRGQTPPSPSQALAACEEMLGSGEGLSLLLPLLPEGSTLEDARRFRERQKQAGRRPSACMRAVIEEA